MKMPVQSRTSVLAAAGRPEHLTVMLKQALTDRRVGDGLALLESARDRLEAGAPDAARAGLAGHVENWVDIGFDRPELVQRLLEHFAPPIVPISRSSDTPTCASRKVYDRVAQ